MTPLGATSLTKSFRGRTSVLDGLDLELAAGAVTVLLGRNGTGKSTFMRLCLGTLRPDAGAIAVGGLDPCRRARAVRRSVGYVPDMPDVYGWMTPWELYRFLKPQYPAWDDALVEDLAGSLRVPVETKFRALSRGEGMKAMLVAALAHRPPLLLLDEPFAGLDPVVRSDVLRGVIDALKEGGRTVLCATHDLDVAARIADRVAVLDRGRIAVHGAVDDVLKTDTRAPERMRALLLEVAAS